MRKLNKKGFTLIESIITFAILAIAGTMFLFGFYNVSVVFTDGVVIKDETNALYDEVLLANESIKDANTKDMIVSFKGTTTTASIGFNKYSKTTFVDDEYSIKLNYYKPIRSADFSSDDKQEEVEPERKAFANFYFLYNLYDLPSNKIEMPADDKFRLYQSNKEIDLLSLENNELFNVDGIENTIGNNNLPDIQTVKNDIKSHFGMADSYIDSSYYQDYLSGNFDDIKVRWFFIKKNISLSSVDVDSYDVYGYIYTDNPNHSGQLKGVYFIVGDSVMFCPVYIVNGELKLYQYEYDKYFSQLNGKKFKADGYNVEYPFGQINSGNFLNDFVNEEYVYLRMVNK